MKILLIAPAPSPLSRAPRAPSVHVLALHLLAGITPAPHQVTLIEEGPERVDLDEPCDLVGISCSTPTVTRAYQLADAFRQRGRRVVLGGVHPTKRPDEALLHSDAVIRGEAEGVWAALLADAEKGLLQKTYQGPTPELTDYVPMSRRKAAPGSLLCAVAMETTRGCPFHCDFCAVTDFYGSKLRHRPTQHLVRDLRESGARSVAFLDDNIVGDPRYARELFRALIPLGIQWSARGSIAFARHPDLLKLARESGCVAFDCEIETIAPSNPKNFTKSMKDLRGLEDGIRRIQDHGIHLNASLLFGFDGDTKAAFPEALDFLSRHRVATARFGVLTPYPGTRLHETLKAQGRLLTLDWRHYDGDTVVFRPHQLTPVELLEGVHWMKREFTRFGAVLSRYVRGNARHPLLHFRWNAALRRELGGHGERSRTLQNSILPGSTAPIA
ncbi:MAG: B12-binding domain-containing radical SAM protein [Spirochaetes bacterium]|nr:B12-binding domain-containing radical SAM protein [Spirochaetota bacterium]